MRYVAAYLLSSLGASNTVSATDIEKILASVGIEADKEKITKIIRELKGKNLEELIEEGQKKLATVPSGGGPAAAATAAPAGEAKVEEKETKKEESESEDEDMGFGLFD